MVASGGSTYGQIGEQQMVVHHQQVGRGRLAPGLVEETAAVVIALDSGAGIALAGYFFPQGGRDIERQIGPAAVRGLAGPLGQCGEIGPLFLQKQLALLVQSLQLVQTKIVAHSLDQHCTEFTVQHLLQLRNILVDQLFLQIDGVGGDHHPLPVAYRPQDCRNQVGQALSGAGSGLDEGHPGMVESLCDRFGHGFLGRPVVVVAESVGQGSAGGEHLEDFGNGQHG